MVVIRFQDGSEWFKANWVFRRLLQSVVERYPDNGEIQHALREAEAIGALFLDSEDADKAARIIEALCTVSDPAVQREGKYWQSMAAALADEERQYSEALSELHEMATGAMRRL